MLLRLDPPLWIETPCGIALAHVMCDYGLECSVYWIAVIEKDGRCARFENEQVRFPKNYTLGRLTPELPRGHPRSS